MQCLKSLLYPISAAGLSRFLLKSGWLESHPAWDALGFITSKRSKVGNALGAHLARSGLSRTG